MNLRHQQQTSNAKRGALGVLVAALLATACGGGDDATDAPDTSSPPSTAAPAVSTSTTLQSTTTTTEPPLQLTDNAKLSTAGLGPVRIGMTVEEGERVSGVALIPTGDGDDSCRYHTPDRGPGGVAFMVSDGEIVRVDVTDNVDITTLSGYGIGSTTDELLDAFGERIERSAHPSDAGEYVAYVPVDELDLDKRVIWETDSEGVVTAMRAGRVPFVEFAEGCA